MATKLRKTICALLCFILCIIFLTDNRVSAAGKKTVELDFTRNGEIPDEYKKVAESDVYSLYLYEKTMSIILQEKAGGKVFYSAVQDWEDDGKNNKTWDAYVKSGVVVQTIKGNVDTYQADLVISKTTMSYKYLDNGFCATIFWPEYQFGFDVVVTLEGEELVVEIPEDSVKESGKDIYIGSISVFPMFGHTYLDAQEGYMLVPDGNGALIYLTDKDARYSSGFSQVIYGSDAGFSESKTRILLQDEYDSLEEAEKVIAPVFGMVHTDDRLGYLAVVEDGALRCSIEVAPNGVMVNYNRSFAKFTMRKVYVQPLNNSNSGTVKVVENDRSHSNMRVRYLLVNGDKADYSGLAEEYRDYLIDNGTLKKQDVSYKTRVDFLGSDREEFLFFTTPVTMTTTKNIEEIYDDLRDNGVKSLLTVYKGWQKGGLYDLPITKYAADSSIGGTKALTKLIKSAGEYGYDIFLYNDVLYSNPSTSNTTFNAVKKINKRKLEIDTKAKVFDTLNYVLPFKMASILNEFVKSYTKQGVDKLAIAGASNNVYSYYTNQTYYTRYQCEEGYTGMIRAAAEKTRLVLEEPFAYLWSETEAFLDMPLGSSDYMYEDEEIPFLSMVLKGSIPMYSDYVNFEANKSQFMLQMLEAGIYPSFYITYENSAKLIYTNSRDLYSTKYSTYRDTIIEYDKLFSEVAEATADAYITKHEKLSENVKKVTYSNGVKLYVNYGSLVAVADGITVPALSAKVVK